MSLKYEPSSEWLNISVKYFSIRHEWSDRDGEGENDEGGREEGGNE